MLFYSPSKGPMDFDAMFEDLVAFIRQDPQAEHKLIIGSDSQPRDDTVFVTAVVVHRLGKGGRFYYHRRHHPRMHSLRQRIFYEASLSLSTASRVTERLARQGYSRLNVEIHLDIGPQGDTRDMIREIVGMVTGSGFEARVKPDSYGAKVADKFTK